ncbi:MAG: class I SAM-dependent methyltransferase [Sporolactobacillus sp.]
MKNTEKFSGKAGIYSHYRPNYPEALIDDLINAAGLTNRSSVADVGAGTGIFTRQLAARGLPVAAIEPNEGMRQEAMHLSAPFAAIKFIAAPAEAIPLPDGSVDLITAAQAFHWFDAVAFRKECRRLLKPRGVVALIWNSRDSEAPLTQDCARICQTFCPEFNGFSGGHMTINFRSFFQNGAFTEKQYAHPLTYTRDQFIGRYLSASYAPTHPQEVAAFRAALAAVFETYAIGDVLPFPNETRLYLGNV